MPHNPPSRPISGPLRAALGLAALLLVAAPAGAQGATPRLPSAGELDRALQARRDTLIDFFAAQVPPTDLTRGGYFEIAANLYRGRNVDWALARLDTVMAHPAGDMFWMYPFVTAMYANPALLPEATQRRMRDLWRTYRPYRGDTENHWVLYYSTLYLAAQRYPGEPGETWFNGKSSAENLADAEGWLRHWMDLATTIGQGEYDSPSYLRVYLAPMALLHAYAEDPAMQRRASMMLDYLIADFAVESLNGLPGGGHSRVYEREAILPWRAPSTAPMSWLLFGNTRFAYTGESFILALSGYAPGPLLHGIATDRSRPYVHRELKRTRHRMRYSDVRNAPVYKYTYVRPEYVLGSTQGGLLQPIQQQTWSLVWNLDDPREARNTLFSLQPYSSPTEMAMYFAEFPEFVTTLVIRSKREYDSPDKLTGGSPYEQVVQEQDALVALYDIAPGTRFPHVSAFFSADLAEVDEDASGWIFARGGDAYIAYYPLAPYTLVPHRDLIDSARVHRRLHSPHLRNGAVVQVAPASDFASMEAFQTAVRALPLDAATAPVPRVRFTSLRGDRIEATFGETPRINGAPVDYAGWPLYEGPFMEAAPGSRTLDLRYGPLHRRLDFNALSVTDWTDAATSDAP